MVKSDSVREKIYSLHPGDQIRITGRLINYGYPGQKPFRYSSRIRTDDGNGACEVILVDSVSVLGLWKPGWWTVRTVSAKVALASGVTYLLLFIALPVWDNAKKKKETDAMVTDYNHRMSGER